MEDETFLHHVYHKKIEMIMDGQSNTSVLKKYVSMKNGLHRETGAYTVESVRI